MSDVNMQARHMVEQIQAETYPLVEAWRLSREAALEAQISFLRMELQRQRELTVVGWFGFFFVIAFWLWVR